MMQNRYDRNNDHEHSPARRDERDTSLGNYNRDEDDRRYGEQWRGEPSRGERGDQWRPGERSYRAVPRQSWSNREGSGQNYAGPWQSAAGRSRDRDDDEYERSSWEREGRQSRDQGSEEDWHSRSARSTGRRNPDVRGYYQEQHWARDPSTGNLYGYEYSTRLLPRSAQRDEGQRRETWNDPARSAGWSSDRSATEEPWPSDRWRRWNPRSEAHGGASSQRASHYGKGPKGYVRSDERIREDVCDRLSDDDEVDASEIAVSVKEGEVTLEGSVSDRHSKHRAEDIAESVSGVRDVTNKLRTRKGFLQELGDKLSGDDEIEHRGHTGSGTRNSPSGIGNRGAQSH